MATDKTDNDGYAFPLPDGAGANCRRGMTLRDYFAGQALMSVSAGIIAEANFGTTEQSLASVAYSIADAMLAERAK